MNPAGSVSSEFREEILEANLRRIAWLLGAVLVLTAGSAVSLGLWGASSGRLNLILAADLALAAVFLAWNFRLRRCAGSPWRGRYVWASVVLCLGLMDVYYFATAEKYGPNPGYILGVVSAGAIFLLPPRGFLPLLIGNHLVYGALLWLLGNEVTPWLPVFVANTTGVTVAGLTSVLLFQAKRREFWQRHALASSHRALEKKNAQLNEFLAITAHDLRSPLLGVRDLLVLLEKTPLSGNGLEIVRHASRSCVEMVSFVNRLLEGHAAEERAAYHLVLRRQDVREPLAAAIERAEARCVARRISLMREFPEVPVECRIDASAVEQVMDNLLSNAVKFSPEGSEIRVRLSRDAAGWFCDVSDRGPGIPEGERKTIFQKFRRGTPQTGDPGSGLGLYIAATFMRAMEGDLLCLPDDSQGATFRLRLPGGPRVPVDASQPE